MENKITEVTFQKLYRFSRKGPYKLWNHFHEFIPNKEGVLMKDTVDYELPFGFWEISLTLYWLKEVGISFFFLIFALKFWSKNLINNI